ncbi:hypothetical protein PFICI_06909 [Pestalotiopsis fici W106-1]|uniref:Uncharacterized protein n=1 Tax=Pestalotiopsis fici (strain W106-1 / CGMCC3.15140) TaxID=1229662 RepID=W3X936_PESFW|nr:uncharacterized protein PFICI_06909 [Pestalotiopsis fici W106-1]ETS81907.1 hypothetical protein PFICI_06909 [Pestalotiopsis fici W106-1]
MAPERIHRARRAAGNRDVRGAGWHRSGYRDGGQMWINVNEGTYTRGRDVWECQSLADFAHDLDGWFFLFLSSPLLSMEKLVLVLPGQYKCRSITNAPFLGSHVELPDERQEGMWVDVFFRKKSLFDLAEEYPNDLVENWFNGGETVYRKYYDPEGFELKNTGFRYQPTAKRAHRLRSPPFDPHVAQRPQPRTGQQQAAGVRAPARDPAAGGMSLADCMLGAFSELARCRRMTPAQWRAHSQAEDDRIQAIADGIMEEHQLRRQGEAEAAARATVQRQRAAPRAEGGVTRARLHQLERRRARAVGRTPQEIEELEAALDARRRRRLLTR